MPLLDFEIADRVLNEQDRRRILCVFLSTRDDGSVDWNRAHQAFGGVGKVESFKTVFSRSLKKITTAGEGGSNGVSHSGSGGHRVAKPVTPSKRKSANTFTGSGSGRGLKNKTLPEIMGEGNIVGQNGPSTDREIKKEGFGDFDESESDD